MSARIGHRVRWVIVWTAIAVWFVALALNLGGNGIHVLLLAAIGLLVYELLAEEPPRGA
ncbi:MAG: hypothetical protein ACRDGE_00360 [Candidatus Limnocylindria bacterium]